MSWFNVLLYSIVSIGIVIYGTKSLSPYGMLRSILFAIGSILLFIFFGFRWFSSATTSKSWPPTINMCPDYLTFVPNVPGASSASGGVCLDLLGVTKSSSGLKKSDPSYLASISPTDTLKVFEFTSADVAAAQGKSSTLQAICNRCQQTGLTWEGVYDGDVCQGLNRASLSQGGGSQCN